MLHTLAVPLLQYRMGWLAGMHLGTKLALVPPSNSAFAAC